jgi:hypothetical protein
MPFSAATGLTEAASAVGTAGNDKAQAISMQAAVAAAANAPDRLFNVSVETGRDMKSSLAALTGRPCNDWK